MWVKFSYLSYARLYNGTVAADYYRAMNDVERRLEFVPTLEQPHTEPGQLVALVDALSCGTLNDSQRELVHALRSGILALTEQKDSETDLHPPTISARLFLPKKERGGSVFSGRLSFRIGLQPSASI